MNHHSKDIQEIGANTFWHAAAYLIIQSFIPQAGNQWKRFERVTKEPSTLLQVQKFCEQLTIPLAGWEEPKLFKPPPTPSSIHSGSTVKKARLFQFVKKKPRPCSICNRFKENNAEQRNQTVMDLKLLQLSFSRSYCGNLSKQ